ncbi:MAG: Flp family type IVb pilin [Actinomycetota bacterium]
MLSFIRASTGWATTKLDIRSERAATAVEYAILIALITAVLVGAVYFLGRETSTSFRCVDIDRPC